VSVVGVIAAGGSGERLGASVPKAFVVVGAKPLYEWSALVLREVCDRVLVVVPPETSDLRPQTSDFVDGGASRSASVRNAVLAEPTADVYVVHDAARPLVEVELVRRCLAALEGVEGAIAAARVTDTVKEADEGGRVLRTLDRSVLWSVQTPQVFRGDALRSALNADDSVLAAATDDASLVEEAGGTIAVVEAPRENIKVTTPLDLRVAEAVLEARC
jgi:2-C-methyl-D-erythritol 4-phosphate cytidylyltransferase